MFSFVIIYKKPLEEVYNNPLFSGILEARATVTIDMVIFLSSVHIFSAFAHLLHLQFQ